MSPGLADRLSRAMIWWHPRRWRQRYGEELLDFLDQHDAGARTVVNLAASALTAHLDPAFRGRPRGIRLSPPMTTLAVGTASFAFVAAIAGFFVVPWPWVTDSWHLSGAGGVSAVAFFPGQHLLVSASGGAHTDSMDTVWDVANPVRPRQLSAFQGGEPTVASPDGRTLATVTYDGKPALWNMANPGKPARIAVAAASDGNPLLGEAFSPDGRTLATAYADKIFLWDVASPARPRLLDVVTAPVTTVLQGEFGVVGSAGPFSPQDITFSPDGRLLASVTGTGQISVWDVSDPARAARTAVLGTPRDYTQVIAFSSAGHLLAGVTYQGRVLVFSLADPARPARTAATASILAHAFFPDGRLTPEGPACDLCSPAAYAVAFAPDGSALTVVVDRTENDPSAANAARDTVFAWTLTGSGALGTLTTTVRNVKDNQPTLAPGGHTVVDGSPTSNAVSLWPAAGAAAS